LKNNTAKYQFLFLILLLSAPFIFHLSPLENYPLNGYSEKYKWPEININNWLSGETQKQTDNYLNQEFGFRTDIVHFNNEWQYRILNKANTKKVIVGKDDYLFSMRYIDAYIGNDYIGKEKAEEKVKRISKLNNQLDSLGKKMIVVIAPGKGSFYPEYIPDRYFPKKEINNYEVLSERFEKEDFDFIDFNQLFISMKDTSQYPLYPKTGIHWSEYGLAMMADSLVNYVEKIKGIDLPDLNFGKMRIKPGAERTDMDIEKSMNLIWKIPNIEMAYPRVTYDAENKDSTKVLLVADSFYWQMFGIGLSRWAFNGSQFFYYNNTFHPQPKEGSNKIDDIDLQETLDKYEVVILMTTEANLVDFPWRFDKRVDDLINDNKN